MQSYNVTLKSGHSFKTVSSDSTKNLISLWVWAVNQKEDKVLTLTEGAVLASEIALITYEEEY